MGRTECKGRLAAKYTATQLSRTELGSRVIRRDKQLIFEKRHKPINRLKAWCNVWCRPV